MELLPCDVDYVRFFEHKTPTGTWNLFRRFVGNRLHVHHHHLQTNKQINNKESDEIGYVCAPCAASARCVGHSGLCSWTSCEIKDKGKSFSFFFHELYKETRFHCVHLFSQEPFKNVSIDVKLSAATFKG